jgi:hypothetical protein
VSHFHEFACVHVKNCAEYFGGEFLTRGICWYDSAGSDVAAGVDEGNDGRMCNRVKLRLSARVVCREIITGGIVCEDAKISNLLGPAERLG